MAKKTNGTRSDLIHCDNCDEEYSATYKRCPFCGARPDRSAFTQSTSRLDLSERTAATRRPADTPPSPPPPQRSAPRPSAHTEDDYVFDGQGVFDDEEDDDDYNERRGGKRLADGGFPLSPTTIAGIIFSIVVIIAAILIVVNFVLPKVRDGRTPTGTNNPNGSLPGTSQTPSVSPSNSGGVTPDPVSPSPVVSPSPSIKPSVSPSPSIEPSVSPSPSATTSDGQPTGFVLVDYRGRTVSEFTISDRYPNPVQLQPSFTPSGTTATVTWSSSNTKVVTVNSKGVVTAVGRGNATITATLSNGLTQTCKVISTISSSAASPSPSVSTSPEPTPPVEPSAEPTPPPVDPPVDPSTDPAIDPSTDPSTSPEPSAPVSPLRLSSSDITISNQYPSPVRLQATGGSGDITWSSSDTSIATVDANGTVTRVGRGRCTITATDSSGQTATCTVRCNN